MHSAHAALNSSRSVDRHADRGLESKDAVDWKAAPSRLSQPGTAGSLDSGGMHELVRQHSGLSQRPHLTIQTGAAAQQIGTREHLAEPGIIEAMDSPSDRA